MNKHLRYSLLIMLAFALTISLVHGLNIGASTQARPYESNPTVATPTAGLSATWGKERDGDLATSVAISGVATSASGTVVLSGFKNTPPATFTIGWVDLKIKYKHPTSTDDTFRIGYKTSATAYSYVQPLVTGAAATFDQNGNPAVRVWSNIATYPLTDAPWDWTDISNFAVQIFMGRGTNAIWDATVDLFEVWLTIYETAPPTTGSATVSLQPNNVMGLAVGSEFFVDIYIRDVTKLWGYQFYIYYDTNVLTATGYFSYNIFNTAAPSWINDAIGEVEVSFTSVGGDLVGFTGSQPLARIYFKVDAGGATNIYIDTTKPGTGLVEAGTGSSMPYTAQATWFSTTIIMSLQPPTVMPIGTNPIGTQWHELYPHYSNVYTLTSWLDNGDLDLSASDQIDMLDTAGFRYWFHVDLVTVTIHWTFKAPDTGTAEAEITPSSREFTVTNPIGSTWHQIYPVYSRTFTITSWTDNGDGKFSVSDQFDFQYTPYDVLLVGVAPAQGSALTAPGVTNMYYDADADGKWSVGEPAIDDVDMDGFYDPDMGDVVLVGTAPAQYEPLNAPGALDKFYDADLDTLWSVGEPAINDADASGTYTPAETHWAHLDAVSTDIILSQKGEPEPPVPEFPLGLGLVLAAAPLIPIIHVWRTKRRVMKK